MLTLSNKWAKQINLAQCEGWSNGHPCFMDSFHLHLLQLHLEPSTENTGIPHLLGQLSATQDIGKLRDSRKVHEAFRWLTIFQWVSTMILYATGE